MEPVVATRGNPSQIGPTRKPQKQAKSVATGCHRLPAAFHGKEGSMMAFRWSASRPKLGTGIGTCLSAPHRTQRD
jgi:hypothetical protein